MAVRTAEEEVSSGESIEGVVQWVRARWEEPYREPLQRFVRAYFAGAAPEDLASRRAGDLYGAALSHWHLGREPLMEEPRVNVFNPDPERHGWESTHTIVDVVVPDQPFLVDSVSMALNREGLTVHQIIHPVLPVVRDDAGRWRDLAEDLSQGRPEAWMHFEVDRRSGRDALEGLQQSVEGVLEDTRCAVADWQPMRKRLSSALSSLGRQPPAGLDAEELEEVREFLRWVRDDHFTFLGYRCYDLTWVNGERVLKPQAGTGLGVLRGEPRGRPTRFTDLPKEARDRATDAHPLIMTKSNHRATVHRPGYMDYLGVKRFNAEGQVIGEHRFLGLYTSAAYTRIPQSIPLLRRKVQYVLERAGFPKQSHSGKALVNVLETYPRDELIQIEPDDLLRIATGILHLQERQRVRLFVRHDTWQRFFVALVFVPRERYDTDVRRRMQAILEQASGGDSSEFSVQLSESVLARIQFTVRVPRGGLPPLDIADLEARIAATVRLWQDDLHAALLDYYGEERGTRLFHKYREAFSTAYREEIDPRAAAHDIERIEALAEHPEAPEMTLYRPLEAVDGSVRFKIFHGARPATLSDALPVLEHMGVRVVDERPFEVTPRGGATCWIHDFGLLWEGEGVLDVDSAAEAFQEAFAMVWQYRAEDDGFNRLVLAAELPWTDVVLLRAYSRYLRQSGATFSQSYIEETLVAHPAIVSELIALFAARFDPERADSAEAERLAEELEGRLRDEVTSLDEDRILRRFLAAIQATVRTNRYRVEADQPLALKLRPGRIPEMPKPHPWAEVFVYATDVEGVHLRGGEVARGGIRWSDRREDFRTEVLGLMKAQMVKNAVIVPVGAKGGFVAKPAPTAPGDPWERGRAAYQRYIGALLEITDNLVAGAPRPPERVVRQDGDDPYLVVAADKGTATFSDLANTVSERHGYWLQDAFASGGSSGYDHKAMGITARGAWVGVQRHFRELGVDVQREPVRVAGVGDMSGDVFGNGMLLSEAVRVVAAFDHRHVFLDPNPDPAVQYAERQRLFALPRSSWDDYDRTLLSEGGGVHPRTAKSIELTPQVRELLDVDAERMTPLELIRAILCAPVDLLWNGGIGTYIKARAETHADVDDRANDPVRVDAADLRCRVVGEGGNLGLTQRARIEYAARGGRINTDFLDNSGGVDCSDHEVNIKILLNELVADGELTRKHRDELLKEMTPEVAELVLANSYRQTQSLSLSETRAASCLNDHWSVIRQLEREGLMDRSMEGLPDDETLTERRGAGQGLCRPELAVLQAYVKIAVQTSLLPTPLPDDPALQRVLLEYFPRPLPERYPERIRSHRLRRELVATLLANDLVNRMGPTFVHRLGEQYAVSLEEIARAWRCADEVFSLADRWRAVEATDGRVAAQAQLELLLRLRGLHEETTVWLVQHVGFLQAVGEGDPHGGIVHLRNELARLQKHLPTLLPEPDAQAVAGEEERLRQLGVPEEEARASALIQTLRPALDLVHVAHATGVELLAVARVHYRVLEALGLRELRDRLTSLPAGDPWQLRFRQGLEADFHLEMRQVVCQLLQEHGGTEDGVAAYLEARATPVQRLSTILQELRSAAEPSEAMVAVAVQELRGISRLDGGLVEARGR